MENATRRSAPGASRLTGRVHELLRSVIRAGDVALDATAGNGHDTVMLAELVGPTGRVIAFDVQAGALSATRARLEERRLGERVTLLLEDHASLAEHVTGLGLRAATFNLGYLPGAPRGVVTSADSTVRAIAAALEALVGGGIVTIVAYTGHGGGREEAAAVLRSVRALDRGRFAVERERAVARSGPRLVVVRRAGSR